MVNIVEIVNELPIGTKLYSTICGECTIKKIYEGLGFDVISKDGTTYNFSYDGRFDLNGECCIFPSKENRDWSNVNIKVEVPFEPKIGDIVANDIGVIFIYSGNFSEFNDKTNFAIYPDVLETYYDVTNGDNWFEISKSVRYATANEEKLLFDIMNKNGYFYNELKNCISKKRKFKVGDKIMRSDSLYPILTITYVNDMIYTVKSEISGQVTDIGVKIVENNYKIATFSPYDLKPFDKILVRSWGRWGISHFEYFDNGIVYTENEKWYKENVLPYNDATKHLIGSCDDYDGFYKWWE
jgi:hypothetical protein